MGPQTSALSAVAARRTSRDPFRLNSPRITSTMAEKASSAMSAATSGVPDGTRCRRPLSAAMVPRGNGSFTPSVRPAPVRAPPCPPFFT